MGFIGRIKISAAVLFIVFGVILCTRGNVSQLYAENAQNKASSEPAKENTETTPDNNSDTQNESKKSDSDPNNPAEAPLEEDEDDFSPRISTFIKINETYEKIFNAELVTDDGMAHYSTLRRKRTDLIQAAHELKQLNPAVLMSLSKQQRIAFWINAYNVCTLKLIIDNYPIEPKLYMIFYPDNSIMQISGDWRTKHFFEVQGLEYNLREIEQELLLERHKDPRICFALSYASLGGAILRNEPYTAEKLDEQLNDQVQTYLQSARGLRLDKEKNILHLSNLFTMYGHKELFLNSKYAKIKKFRDRKQQERAWLNFIRNYLPEEDIRYLETKAFIVKFMKYDWLLNEAR